MGADEQPVAATTPALFVHDRCRRLGPVAADDAAAVIEWLGRGRAADAGALARVRDLAEWAHDRHWWLVCGCRPAAERPPLLVPVNRFGRFFLSRWPGTPHHPDCPLAMIESGGPQRSPARGRGPWNGNWRLLGSAVDTANGFAIRRQRTHRRTRDPSAGRIEAVLLGALVRAGYTRLRASDVICRSGRTASHVCNPYAGVRALTHEPVAGDVIWGDIACTYLPSLAAHLDTLSSIADRFPHDVRPLGVFLGIVDEIEPVGDSEHELVWRSAGHGTVTARIGVPVRWPTKVARDTSGPFWVLLVLGSAPHRERSVFAAVQAIAQPVLSRRVLMPVNNTHERATAELLLRQITYWAKPASRLGLEVELEKPMFDEETSSGSCRPDFTLWLPDSRRVIVLVATADEATDVREERTPPDELSGVAAVVTHHPGRDNSHRFARKLTAVMHAVVEQPFSQLDGQRTTPGLSTSIDRRRPGASREQAM